MIVRIIFFLILFLLFAKPSPVFAQGKAALAREMAEYVMKKFGKEVADESVETLTRKIQTVILKYGDDGVAAVKKIGPRSFRLIEEAGENGLKSVKLMAKYGDEAIWVVGKKNRLAIFVKYGDNAADAMIKHGEIAEPLIGKFGDSAALALKKVSPQNARRISMLEDAGELAAIGRTPELLRVVGKYGDKAMDFIWKNKGALTVAAALTAFLANPEPFINGSLNLAKVVSDSVVEPIAQGTNWTLIILILIAGACGIIGLRYGFNRQPRLATSIGTSKTREPSDTHKSSVGCKIES
jgi:hypothetical protein